MASSTSYTTLITRATDSDNDDQSQLYDIVDKVKSGGADGAIQAANAIKERLGFPETNTRRRVLNILDTLIIECGSDLHKALIQNGFFVSLADIHDKEIEELIPQHVARWRAEMGAEYETALEQAFSKRGQTSGTEEPQQPRKAEGVARRMVGGMGQFNIKPIKPLVPFLTVPYLRARQTLEQARDAATFHMQSMFLARQALHLVVLLNDSLNEDITDEQEDERIDLEDEIDALREAITAWMTETDDISECAARIALIKEQYETFFKSRFYFQNTRRIQDDKVYKKLLAYDQRVLRIQGMSIMRDPDADRDEGGAYIESVKSSPAPNIQEPVMEEAQKTVITSVVEETSTAAALAAEPPPPAQEVAASTSAGGGTSMQDDIERARQFRSQQGEGSSSTQTFACPVPGCGRSFDKQYLLRHHIREHDDRPYRCPMRGCDRRFATPTDQRVHEALHRIKNMGIVPNMPAFAPPIAQTTQSAPPAAETTVAAEAAEEVKSEGKPEDVKSEGGDMPESERPEGQPDKGKGPEDESPEDTQAGKGKGKDSGGDQDVIPAATDEEERMFTEEEMLRVALEESRKDQQQDPNQGTSGADQQNA
ncbi:hypothetical protein PIIN_08885 [Serendipita indica DSM 11827]|uniref:C2H2-type domain-containing protein n=1 Tax=Serendipita indica (strain DSM 11827) TaxID=1109443 RepID=G4TUC2_SERID|nr:hypothetical protein PIIN_08885 [Serendipita indica DSM 11827]